jgi:methylated-DNA-[protein]-cysteine S-methyltransferase
MTDIRYTTIDSPLGQLLTARDEVGLTALLWPHAKPGRDWRRDGAGFDDVRTQLGEYFAGERRHFELPLHPRGSAFQVRVWAALREIPYGETTSYGELAASIDAPGSARAVGTANGQNPISIIVPCHRVIGADGSLTGFGGGLPAKKFLLGLEAQRAGLFAEL